MISPTAAERKRMERERKREAGLVRVDEWVPAACAATLRRIAADMRAEHQGNENAFNG
jgi:hypothetical protein